MLRTIGLLESRWCCKEPFVRPQNRDILWGRKEEQHFPGNQHNAVVTRALPGN